MFVITGGYFKNHSLQLPPKEWTRPTSSRAREGLFNILMHRYEDALGRPLLKEAVILDLYSGSGSLGLEALSRGAGFCVFCEIHEKVLPTLRYNIGQLNLQNKSLVLPSSPLSLCTSAWNPLARPAIIFMDPPYNQGLIPQTLMNPLIKEFYHQGSLIISESDQEESFSKEISDYHLDLERIYGKAKFSFFKVPA